MFIIARKICTTHCKYRILQTTAGTMFRKTKDVLAQQSVGRGIADDKDPMNQAICNGDATPNRAILCERPSRLADTVPASTSTTVASTTPKLESHVDSLLLKGPGKNQQTQKTFAQIAAMSAFSKRTNRRHNDDTSQSQSIRSGTDEVRRKPNTKQRGGKTDGLSKISLGSRLQHEELSVSDVTTKSGALTTLSHADIRNSASLAEPRVEKKGDSTQLLRHERSSRRNISKIEVDSETTTGRSTSVCTNHGFLEQRARGINHQSRELTVNNHGDVMTAPKAKAFLSDTHRPEVAGAYELSTFVNRPQNIPNDSRILQQGCHENCEKKFQLSPLGFIASQHIMNRPWLRAIISRVTITILAPALSQSSVLPQWVGL